MNTTNILPTYLKKRTFSASDAKSAGISLFTLRLLVKEGQIRRITRNHYLYWELDEEKDAKFEAANQAIGLPSAICLLSALEYYDLSDEISQKIWVMVPRNKRSKRKEVKLFRCSNPEWVIGIKKSKEFWITNIDRTLIDCLYYQKYLGPFIAIKAIKIAIADKKTTLLNIANMAKKLGRYEKIKSYIEAIL